MEWHVVVWLAVAFVLGCWFGFLAAAILADGARRREYQERDRWKHQ